MRRATSDLTLSMFQGSQGRPGPVLNGNSKSSEKASAGSSGSRKAASGSASMSGEALLYMSLLALQFGIQPSLTKRYISGTCNTSACRSSVVLVQEVIKFVIACSFLVFRGEWKDALADWSIGKWVAVAFVPSALYCVQNLSALLAYQNLDPITFNVLNQTKTLSAALCCYFVMGRRQSRVQIMSLFLLLLAALVIEGIVTLDTFIPSRIITSITTDQLPQDHQDIISPRRFTHGVIPVLAASFLSGLAGALSQKNLQTSSGCGASGGRNSYLFSMELCMASTLILATSLFATGDAQKMMHNGFFHQWTNTTFLPILTNSLGGLLVGLVTKYAGTVRKGFALVFGIFLSGIIQAMTDPTNTSSSGGATTEQIVGGTITAVSLLLHCTHPYVPPQNSSNSFTNGAAIQKNHSQNGKLNGSDFATPTSTVPKKNRRKTRKED